MLIEKCPNFVPFQNKTPQQTAQIDTKHRTFSKTILYFERNLSASFLTISAIAYNSNQTHGINQRDFYH